MLQVTVSRPNTLGVTDVRSFKRYAEARGWVSAQVERFKSEGWLTREIRGYGSLTGSIEATHEHHADSIIIEWIWEQSPIKSSTKLEQINRLRQNIHNLRMRVPIGIRSIDDEHDAKLKRLEALLKDLEA